MLLVADGKVMVKEVGAQEKEAVALPPVFKSILQGWTVGWGEGVTEPAR